MITSSVVCAVCNEPFAGVEDKEDTCPECLERMMACEHSSFSDMTLSCLDCGYSGPCDPECDECSDFFGKAGV